MEQIYKTVLVTKPTAPLHTEQTIEKSKALQDLVLTLHKRADRQAALIAFGLSASSAKEYADKLKDFTDEQFNQIVTGATVSITKAAAPEESSVDMTVQILKAKYGV